MPKKSLQSSAYPLLLWKKISWLLYEFSLLSLQVYDYGLCPKLNNDLPEHILSQSHRPKIYHYQNFCSNILRELLPRYHCSKVMSSNDIYWYPKMVHDQLSRTKHIVSWHRMYHCLPISMIWVSASQVPQSSMSTTIARIQWCDLYSITFYRHYYFLLYWCFWWSSFDQKG